MNVGYWGRRKRSEAVGNGAKAETVRGFRGCVGTMPSNIQSSKAATAHSAANGGVSSKLDKSLRGSSRPKFDRRCLAILGAY